MGRPRPSSPADDVGAPRTIVTISPKGAGRPTGTNELFALLSWLRMTPPPSHLVLVADRATGVDRWASELGTTDGVSTSIVYRELRDPDDYIPSQVKDETHAPNFKRVIKIAEAAVPPLRTRDSNDNDADLFVYANSDIVMPSTFVGTIRRIVAASARAAQQPTSRVVLTGIKTDCASLALPSEQMSLRSLAAKYSTYAHAVARELRNRRCTPHSPSGKDYWVYTRGFWESSAAGGIPPLALGRPHFDNYLTKLADARGVAVDTSPVITAAHLGHGYAHAGRGAGNSKTFWLSAMGKYNLRLAIRSYKKINAHEPWFVKIGDIDQLTWQACPAEVACATTPAPGEGATVFIRVKPGKGRSSFPHRLQMGNRTIASEGACDYATTFGCYGRLPDSLCQPHLVASRKAHMCGDDYPA